MEGTALTKNCPWTGLDGVQAKAQLSFRVGLQLTLIGAAEWSFCLTRAEVFKKSATSRDALSTIGSYTFVVTGAGTETLLSCHALGGQVDPLPHGSSCAAATTIKTGCMLITPEGSLAAPRVGAPPNPQPPPTRPCHNWARAFTRRSHFSESWDCWVMCQVQGHLLRRECSLQQCMSPFLQLRGTLAFPR